MLRDIDDGALIVGHGLTVTYGDTVVVDRVDLAVRPHEIVILIGPNGSGKTTLVRTLLGLVEPSFGTVTRRADLVIGYVPQSLQIDPTLPMTVRRFLHLRIRATDRDIEAAAAEVGPVPWTRPPLSSPTVRTTDSFPAPSKIEISETPVSVL